jgi:hypothetical protein
MPSLDERLASIFEAILDTYDAQPPDRRRRLLHHRSFHRETFLEWDDSNDKPAVTQDDLDELSAVGLIDIDFNGQGNYLVRPTADGRRAHRQVQRERARTEQAQPIDVSWAAVRPVLHAVVDVWSNHGASESAFVSIGAIAERAGREPDDLGLIRAIELLAANDWLNADYDDETDELSAQPTMRGVMATRGWPGGDAEVVAERFIAALDDAAAAETDDVRRGWLGSLRDTAMEVGTKTLAEVVSRSVGSAM